MVNTGIQSVVKAQSLDIISPQVIVRVCELSHVWTLSAL